MGQPVTGEGTTFTAPASPTTKKFSRDCGSLKDAGFVQENCITSSSPGGFIAAFVEYDQTTKEERNLVYRESGNNFDLVLRRIEPMSSSDFASVVKSDLNDDGDPKAVFTTPSTNAEFADTLDVVDTSGEVVIHLDLKGGFAKAATGGGLEAWFPAASGGYTHDLIRYLGGKWTVDSQDHQSETQAQPNQGGGIGAFTP